MIRNHITQLVKEHYQEPGASVLLLSVLGKTLTDRGLWPVANEKRALREIAEGMPDIELVRDEEAVSFIAVVPKGEEKLAHATIEDRHKRHFLRGLPRALLLAFTLDVPDGSLVSVRLGQKLRYQVGSTIEDGTIAVDPDLRLPGLDLSDIGEATSTDIGILEKNIRTWCERHNMAPSSLVRNSNKTIPAAHQVTTGAPLYTNALERLYASQREDAAKLLTIPMDIALALSRMP